jgi:hypothetical protein
MARLNHAFAVEHAELYGVECAILIAHFQFWIEQNQAMKRNFHDGKTWMYQTQSEIAAVYPYWTEDIVFKLIKKLVDFGVLIKGNYNKSHIDRTIWYAFKNEKMFTKPSNDGIDPVKRRNANRQMTEAIPDTIPTVSNLDDDDRARDRAEEEEIQEKNLPSKRSYHIEYTTPSGAKRSIDRSEIFRSFIGKPFSTETINKAIEKFIEEGNVVSDILKYLETICNQIEAKSKIPKEKKEKSSALKPQQKEKILEIPSFAPGISWTEAEKKFKERSKK